MAETTKQSEKQYNINELLELKKELEESIVEKHNEITNTSLTYEETITTDHVNAKRNKTYKPREKIALEQYYQEVYGLIDKLAKVRVAIQKYNAQQVVEMLQKRDGFRQKHAVLMKIKGNLPKKKSRASNPIRTKDETGEVLESQEYIAEPMFSIAEIDKQLSQLSSEERKINTEIQRTNLNAKVSI